MIDQDELVRADGEDLVRVNSEDVIVVYTMGKVASSSISHSLSAHSLLNFQVHRLEPQQVLELLQLLATHPDFSHLQKRNISGTQNKSFKLPTHLTDSLQVMKAIKEQKPIKLISLIREPVARNISALFQNLPKDLMNDPDAIIERLRQYPINIPDNWFAKDFIPVTGLDVLSMELDRSADHFRFRNNQFDVIILKTTVTDERKSELISDFLGQKIVIQRANEAKNKWYREIYQTIARNPSTIRDDYIKDCFGQRYFRAFFSDEERQAVADKFGYRGEV